MKPWTHEALTAQLAPLNLTGKTVGIHSKLSAIGDLAELPLTPEEDARGMMPFAKTVLHALLNAVGPQGTLFVPTHSGNTFSRFQPDNLRIENGCILDDGYYHPEKSPSTVGVLTETFLADPRVKRSLHPTHSAAAIGPEADYLTHGHSPETQPVGVQNAFTKSIGLNGVILFIGSVLGANTSFHAYETLGLPKLAPFFPGTGAIDHDGIRRGVAHDWTPSLHRDFYEERKRPSRAFDRLRQAGLLKEAQIGNATLYHYEAKTVARFFAETILPVEPDIFLCASQQQCNPNRDCHFIRENLKHLYWTNSAWDSDKIKSDISESLIHLTQNGTQRIG